MKKVLIAVTKSNMGGAGQYVLDLAGNLSKEKYDITVLAGGNGKLHEKLKNINIKSDRIPEMKRDIGILNEIKSFIFLVKYLKKNKFDIIHLNSPKMGGLGALAGRITRVPNIFCTAHGWTFFEDRPFWQKTLIYFFSWITVLLSHKTITITKKDEIEGKKMLFAKNKIIYIPNGIRKIDFLNRKEAENKLQLRKIEPENALRIVTIAELHKNKNLPLAIRSIAKLYSMNANIVYYIIGEGEERNNLVKLIKELRAESYIKLLGSIDEASSYLNAFDVFLLTSTKEGLPYVILEAGLSGIKIVAKDVGGIKDILDDTNASIVEKDDEETVANAILASLKNDTSNIREKIEKEFNLETFIKRVEKLYS